MSRFKRLYDVMLSNGELFEVMPNAKGEWSKDKKLFIQTQTDLENLLEDNFIEDNDGDWE